jgi:hypothetical protein
MKEHLDITAMFLGGPEALGKIISKLEIDSSDKPIRVKDVEKMGLDAQREVEGILKGLQAK